MAKLRRFIGSPAIRITSALLLLLAVLAWCIYVSADNGSGIWLYAGILTTVLAFVSFVHCSRSIHSTWLKVANRFQILIVAGLFSIVYLLLVPLLYLFARAADSLKLRSSDGVKSYWIDRRDEERTASFFERLG